MIDLRPGAIVRIVRAVDREIYDVLPLVGRLGIVDEITEKAPPIVLRLPGGERDAFWPEELEEGHLTDTSRIRHGRGAHRQH